MDQLTKNILQLFAHNHFFQITVTADIDVNGKIYKRKKQKNNNSVLTPKNWNRHKETFFAQRMASYSKSFTIEEKITLELNMLKKLRTNKEDNQVLKDRYISYLERNIP